MTAEWVARKKTPMRLFRCGGEICSDSLLEFYLFAATIFLGNPEMPRLMILNQSYVLLAVAIVVALINFFGAYFTVRRARAKRSNPEGNKPQTELIRSLRSSQ
jgi:phosphotransferase system  glucose/maltose/N-acetylglucosamine-specific IIC component